MYNSNLAYKINDVKVPEWDYFVNEIAIVFNLSEKETERLAKSNTAKLIAAIPFAAQCYEPERTAITHLCLYIAEIKGFQKYCSHQYSDNSTVFKRLAFISTFQGGNEKVIKHGMNMLAYIMIEGYHKSMQYDKENNIYNPFIDGAWDYQQLKKSILNTINSYHDDLLDSLFTDYPVARWS